MPGVSRIGCSFLRSSRRSPPWASASRISSKGRRRLPASSTNEELRAGAHHLEAKAHRLRPRFIAVLGLQAYRTAFRRPRAVIGEQPETLGPARLWLLPNPSGLQAHYQLPEMTRLFRDLHAAAFGAGTASARTSARPAPRPEPVRRGRRGRPTSTLRSRDRSATILPICSTSRRKPSWPNCDSTTATGRYRGGGVPALVGVRGDTGGQRRCPPPSRRRVRRPAPARYRLGLAPHHGGSWPRSRRHRSSGRSASANLSPWCSR